MKSVVVVDELISCTLVFLITLFFYTSLFVHYISIYNFVLICFSSSQQAGHMEEQEVSKQKSRHLILSKTSKCLLKRWLVSEDQKVRTGTVLCKYIAVGTSKEEDFRSPCVGLVKYIAVKEEQFVEKRY